MLENSVFINILSCSADTNYDVALIFDFDTVETLDEYQKSQLHMEFGEFVYSIRIDRACIDYEI